MPKIVKENKFQKRGGAYGSSGSYMGSPIAKEMVQPAENPFHEEKAFKTRGRKSIARIIPFHT